jgi:hypothetical protein
MSVHEVTGDHPPGTGSMDRILQVGDVALVYRNILSGSASKISQCPGEELYDVRLEKFSPNWSLFEETQFPSFQDEKQTSSCFRYSECNQDSEIRFKDSSLEFQSQVEPDQTHFQGQLSQQRKSNFVGSVQISDPDEMKEVLIFENERSIYGTQSEHISAPEEITPIIPEQASRENYMDSFSLNQESLSPEIEDRREHENLEILLGSIGKRNRCNQTTVDLPLLASPGNHCSGYPLCDTSTSPDALECVSPFSDLQPLHAYEQGVCTSNKIGISKRINGMYSCLHCNLQFRQTGNLRKHIQEIHERKKPFDCNFCNVSFSRKHARDTHEKAVYVLAHGKVCRSPQVQLITEV